LNRKPARCRTLVGEPLVVIADPHFIGVVVEPENRRRSVADFKVPASPNAFLRHRARLREVGYPLPIHQHDWIDGECDAS